MRYSNINNYPTMTSLCLFLVITIVTLSSPTFGYPRSTNHHHRYRRDAVEPTELDREQAETSEEDSIRMERDLDQEEDEEQAYQNTRDGKALEFYDYLRSPYYEIENEVLSRTEPSRNNYPDSPIYYIRLPPTPYMFVPGVGYISPPPQSPLSPPVSPFINLPLDFVSNGKPTNIYQWNAQGNNQFQQNKPVKKPNINFVSNGKPTTIYRPKPDNSFGNPMYRPSYRPKPEYNIDFVSNGKPTGIYQPNYDPQGQVIDFLSNGKPSTLFRPSYEDSISPDDSPIYRPIYEAPRPQKPDSNMISINKGPYVFNGRPTDSMYLLRNSYNALYEDALQNFYP